MMANLKNMKTFEEVAHMQSFHPALPGLVQLLTNMVVRGDAKLAGRQPSDRSKFNGCQPAEVTVQDYMIRLCKYGYCSPEVFVCMVVYLGRIRAKTQIVFSSYNIHRLMLTAFVVAAKLRDDVYYTNKYYAKIGGVSLPDINRMEHEFLTQTNWELHVDKVEYDQYVEGLLHAREQQATTAPPARRQSSVASDVKTPAAADAAGKAAAPAADGNTAAMQKCHTTFTRNASGHSAEESAAA